MRSSGNAIARARAIYDGGLNPQSTQLMRGHLEASAAESSALLASAALCDYLKRWNNAGSDEVAKAEAAVHHAIATKPDHYLGHYAKGFLHRTKGEHEAALAAFTETVKHNPDFAVRGRRPARRRAGLSRPGRGRHRPGRKGDQAEPEKQVARHVPMDHRPCSLLYGAIRGSGAVAAAIGQGVAAPLVQPALSGERLRPSRQQGGRDAHVAHLREALPRLDAGAGRRGRKIQPQQQPIHGDRKTPALPRSGLQRAGMAGG